MSADPIPDAEVVEEHDDVPAPAANGHAATSTAIVRRERRSEVIRPLDADQLVESFQAYQELLPKLLDASDYQDAGHDKRFVKKSGWRKVATAFDLDVQIIRSTVERDEHGRPLRAEVWARAIAPSGRAMDGDGYCSLDEDRFSGPRGNQSKLENDLRATATTRAMNRAISGLVGMGEVSAEEVGAVGDAQPFGPPMTDESRVAASRALTALCGGDEQAAMERWGQIKQRCGGYMPEAACVALILATASTGAEQASEDFAGGEAPSAPPARRNKPQEVNELHAMISGLVDAGAWTDEEARMQLVRSGATDIATVETGLNQMTAQQRDQLRGVLQALAGGAS